MKHIFCIAIVLLVCVDYAQAEEGSFVELNGHTDRVTTAVFQTDGKKIVVCNWTNEDTIYQVWDVASGQRLFSIESSPHFSVDGMKIFTFANGTVRILDAESGKELRVLALSGSILKCFWEEKKIITTSDDNNVRIWTLEP